MGANNLHLLTPTERKKIQEGKCKLPFCRRPREKHKHICAKHKHERQKQLNPIAYQYQVLKSSAKRRGIAFSLTKDYFESFCETNDYIRLKGIYSECMTIDRINPDLGYANGNIQMITNYANQKKRWVDYYARQGEVPDDYVPSQITPDTKPASDLKETTAPPAYPATLATPTEEPPF